MNMNSIQQVQALGQSVWLDYIRRGLIKSGELKQLIEEGITGLTANPTILEKAIIGSTDYDAELRALRHNEKKNEEIYEIMAIEDIRQAADLLRPIYDRTHGADGYPCLEISPILAYDTTGSIKEARRLFAALERPNVMVKVPATPQGIPAIRQLTSEGININVTLIFSLDMYDQVKEAYIAGLEDLVKKGGNPAKVASVASFFLSRIDTAVDARLEALIKNGREDLRALLGKAAIASAKIAYKNFKSTFYSERSSALKSENAHVQRLLWASTSTKNPAYSDVMYVEPIIGPDTVNTMPLATIHAFLDYGKAEMTIEQGVAEAEKTLEALEKAGISLKDVTDKLLADGVKAFDDSFTKLMAGIDEKKSRLMVAMPAGVETGLGQYEADVKAAVAELTRSDAVKRIWRKDHTVWKPDPTEISNRLGWLTVTETMHEQVPALQSFAAEIKGAGFRHVVSLGMGGSSLCAEVLWQVFGSAASFPRLTVLDSTVPAAIQAVVNAIDPARTLFLVSSKSGTTTEPNILYKYFRHLLEQTGKADPGQNFVAITDPGTPLAMLAEKEKFRRVFLNPPDIGGRYSVLSYFGLVPGSLIGADIKALLDRADSMREGCASCVPGHENPGMWLGATMGALAVKGRDKLTLVTSPSIGSFGLWVEQLIAESTGKEGKGIIPVAGEPLLAPDFYWIDRLFVYLRLKTDDNKATDAAINALKTSGQPVIVLEMKDKLDLGAEFFRWEFATATAGKILSIHPFNQPDVQRAKDATERILSDYVKSGRLPEIKTTGSLTSLLSQACQGAYFAVMAYLHQIPETDEVLATLRRKVMEQYRIATTLGYGPRFLHSTGQLHKGGQNEGLFLQITTEHRNDLPIPGEPYTFGVVADAQALGDSQALQALGRRVVSLRLSQSDAASLRESLKKMIE
jgi:transaldolase/glucose-6-phosphate isomerase